MYTILNRVHDASGRLPLAAAAALPATRPPLEASVTRQLQATKSEALTTRMRWLLRPPASFFHLLPPRVHTTS